MKMIYTVLDVSGIYVGSASISISRSSISDCIFASMELNISDMGNHRYTLIYRVSHCVSVDWKPSHTLIAKAIGTSMDSTIRKNVRMVSMTSADAWKSISKRLRNHSFMAFSIL